MRKKEHFNNISLRDIFLFINTEIFQTIFFLLIFLLFLESIGLSALNSSYYIEYIIIILIALGFIEIIFNKNESQLLMENKNKRLITYVIFLSLFSGLYLYLKLIPNSNVAFLISIFSSCAIFFISLYIIIDDDE